MNTSDAHNCFSYQNGTLSPCTRELVGEEPLRIVVDGEPVVTLMRTPGGEQELALGFLLTEGIIRSADDIGAMSFCADGEIGNRNEVRVTLASGGAPSRPLPQHRRVFSSCGICGAEAIAEAAEGIPPFNRLQGRLTADDIFLLANTMEAAQVGYRRTGATHAAALAAVPIKLESHVSVREDIGRHNALDKIVGAAARRGFAWERGLLFLSGRISFEMAAKAARAGISDVTGVGAPSALAVGLAERLNMFLAGFVRNRTMVVYSGREALRD